MQTDLIRQIFDGKIAREEVIQREEFARAFGDDPGAFGRAVGKAFGAAEVPEAKWALLDLMESAVEAWAHHSGGGLAACKDKLGAMIDAMPEPLPSLAGELGFVRGKEIERLVAQFSSAVKARLLAGEPGAGTRVHGIKDAFMKLATSRDEKKELVDLFVGILQTKGKFDGVAREAAEMVRLAPLARPFAARMTRRPARCLKFLVVGLAGPRTDHPGSIIQREGHTVMYAALEAAPERLKQESPNIVVLSVDETTLEWDRLAGAVRKRQPTTPLISLVPDEATKRKPLYADSPTSKCLPRPIQSRDLQLAVRYFASLA